MSESNEVSPSDCKERFKPLVMCDCYPEHCTHGDTCWCEPTIEIINGNRVIIHNEPN